MNCILIIKGAYQVPPLKDTHPLIARLLASPTSEDDPREIAMRRNFFENSRQYNVSLSFASIVANIQLPPGNHADLYRIQGAVSHRVPPFAVNANNAPREAHFYFIDSAEANRQGPRQLTGRIVVDEEVIKFPKFLDLIFYFNNLIKKQFNFFSKLLQVLDVMIRTVSPFCQNIRTQRDI